MPQPVRTGPLTSGWWTETSSSRVELVLVDRRRRAESLLRRVVASRLTSLKPIMIDVGVQAEVARVGLPSHLVDGAAILSLTPMLMTQIRR